MITAWLSRIGATVWAWIVAAGALAASILGLYFLAKGKGKAEAEVKEAKRETERQAEDFAVQREAIETRTETVKVAENVANEVNRIEPGTAAERLRDEWTRD